MRAARATDLARATPRPTDGDGDGPLADGRTPVECRAHCASSTGRQRYLARVEPVGRGGVIRRASEAPDEPRQPGRGARARCRTRPVPGAGPTAVWRVTPPPDVTI